MVAWYMAGFCGHTPAAGSRGSTQRASASLRSRAACASAKGATMARTGTSSSFKIGTTCRDAIPVAKLVLRECLHLRNVLNESQTVW